MRRHLYAIECFKAGIKIYLYKKGMLHSKMMIVDDEMVTIGSTNFDFRSFDYNFEANLFFTAKSLTGVCWHYSEATLLTVCA